MHLAEFSIPLRRSNAISSFPPARFRDGQSQMSTIAICHDVGIITLLIAQRQQYAGDDHVQDATASPVKRHENCQLSLQSPVLRVCTTMWQGPLRMTSVFCAFWNIGTCRCISACTFASGLENQIWISLRLLYCLDGSTVVATHCHIGDPIDVLDLWDLNGFLYFRV